MNSAKLLTYFIVNRSTYRQQLPKGYSCIAKLSNPLISSFNLQKILSENAGGNEETQNG
jgi:hypothetical protein